MDEIEVKKQFKAKEYYEFQVFVLYFFANLVYKRIGVMSFCHFFPFINAITGCGSNRGQETS